MENIQESHTMIKWDLPQTWKGFSQYPQIYQWYTTLIKKLIIDESKSYDHLNR